MNKEGFSRAPKETSSDDWETPPEVVKALESFLDVEFTLDACGTEKNKKAPKVFTKETNGLLQSWKEELVFVNPPYSHVKEWSMKCSFEHDEAVLHNRRCLIALLIPARTETKYFHDYCYHAQYFLLCKGRINFLVDGKPFYYKEVVDKKTGLKVIDPKTGKPLLKKVMSVSNFPSIVVLWVNNIGIHFDRELVSFDYKKYVKSNDKKIYKQIKII